MVLLIAGASLAGVLSAGWAPVLGVQLQGGVEVVLRPANEVSDEQFERAIEIIRNRVDAIGVAEPYHATRRSGSYSTTRSER